MTRHACACARCVHAWTRTHRCLHEDIKDSGSSMSLPITNVPAKDEYNAQYVLSTCTRFCLLAKGNTRPTCRSTLWRHANAQQYLMICHAIGTPLVARCMQAAQSSFHLIGVPQGRQRPRTLSTVHHGSTATFHQHLLPCMESTPSSFERTWTRRANIEGGPRPLATWSSAELSESAQHAHMLRVFIHRRAQVDGTQEHR